MTTATPGHSHHFCGYDINGQLMCCSCGTVRLDAESPSITARIQAVAQWVDDNLFFINDANGKDRNG